MIKVGRELDCLVAEKVFGHQVCKNPRGGWTIGEPDYFDSAGEMILCNPLPRYSGDIKEAWEIVRYIQDAAWSIDSYGNDWVVRLTVQSDGTDKQVAVLSPVVEHAICLAALKAIGEQPND